MVEQQKRKSNINYLSDDLIGFGSYRFLAIIGFLCGVQLIGLYIVLTTLSLCGVPDDTSPDTPICIGPPNVTGPEIGVLLVVSPLIGLAYAYLYRIVVRKGWYMFRAGSTVHTASAYAMCCGVLVGGISLLRSGTPLINAGWPLLFLFGLLVTWLWQRNIRFTARWLFFWNEDVAIAKAIHMMVARTLASLSPTEVSVHVQDGTLHVSGPFDAIDERRIFDLLSRWFDDNTTDLTIATTLSTEAYWRHHTSDLAPSRYGSDLNSLPPRRGLPRFVGYLSLGMVTLVSVVLVVAEPWNLNVGSSPTPRVRLYELAEVGQRDYNFRASSPFEHPLITLEPPSFPNRFDLGDDVGFEATVPPGQALYIQGRLSEGSIRVTVFRTRSNPSHYDIDSPEFEGKLFTNGSNREATVEVFVTSFGAAGEIWYFTF